MTTFNKITIEGFGSIVKELKYKFNRPGLITIHGENGSGKSSIFNALPWVLFGQTLKKGSDISPWPHVITPDYKGTKVTLEYIKEGKVRKITHCKEYKGKLKDDEVGKNRLLIEVEGKIQHQLRDKKDGWKWIEQDLNMSFKLFKSSIMFGQKVKRLTQEDGPERNKILEEAFQASFISQAKEIASKALAELNTQKIVAESRMSVWSERENFYKGELKNARELKANFEKDNLTKIADIKSKIKGLKSGIDKGIQEQVKVLQLDVDQKSKYLDKYQKYHDLEFRLNMKLNTLQGEGENLNRKAKGLKESLGSVKTNCLECGSKLDSKKVKDQKDKLKSQIQKSLEDLKSTNTAIRLIEKEYEEVKKTLKKCEKTKLEYNSQLAELNRLKAILNNQDYALKRIEEYRVEIKELGEAKNPIKVKPIKVKLVEATKAFKAELIAFSDMADKMENYEWLMDDPLSNNGLKAYIFDSMLQKTNRELLKYEGLIGFRVAINITLDKARKDFNVSIHRGKQEVPMEDLSGGQSQLVDICIALAIHDSISDNHSTNIMLFDEVFESLDPRNIEAVGSLLMKKAHGRSIHIITHNTAFNPTQGYEVQVNLDDDGHTQIYTKLER